MNETHPRVLVIAGDSIGRHGNGGWTLYNLFKGWPADRLAQVHFDEVNPDSSVCRRHWHLGPDDVPPVVRTMRRLLRGAGFAPGTAAGASRPGRVAGHSENHRSDGRMRCVARAWMDCVPFRVPSACLQEMGEFRPDIIYVLPGPIRPTQLAVVLANKLGAAVVPHFMDDWPRCMYTGSWLTWVPRQQLNRSLAALLRLAPLSLTISPAMADEYVRRYGTCFEAMMNCVDVPKALPPARTDAGGGLQLAYVGGIHLGRKEMLLDVARAANVLRARGIPAEIVCYDLRVGDDDRRELEATGAIRVAGRLPDEGAIDILQQACALLHVEPFAARSAELLRLSLSTKLPLYLAAGRSVLAYGPATMASLRYLGQNRAGLLVTERQPEALAAALGRLLAGAELRGQLGRAAWQLARANHDAPTERARLLSLLRHASRGQGEGGSAVVSGARERPNRPSVRQRRHQAIKP